MNRDGLKKCRQYEAEPSDDECLWGKPGHLEQLRMMHPDVDEDVLKNFVKLTTRIVEVEARKAWTDDEKRDEQETSNRINVASDI